MSKSKFGEGKYTIGTVTVTTDAKGNATFKLISTKHYKYLAATATNQTTGDTSEFGKVLISP